MVMAEICAQCGNYGEAVEIIDYLLSLESCFTVYDFKMDPLLEPLLEIPEFQALMDKYASPSDFSTMVGSG